MSDCQGCDGSGWYRPEFSPDVLVNCLRCNPEGTRGAENCADCHDNGEDCSTCHGFGFVLAAPAAPIAAGDTA